MVSIRQMHTGIKKMLPLFSICQLLLSAGRFNWAAALQAVVMAIEAMNIFLIKWLFALIIHKINALPAFDSRN
jgi:hypothetical protein